MHWRTAPLSPTTATLRFTFILVWNGNTKVHIFLTFSNFTAVFSIKQQSLKEVIFGACTLMLEFIARYCFFKHRKSFEQCILCFAIQWQCLEEVKSSAIRSCEFHELNFCNTMYFYIFVHKVARQKTLPSNCDWAEENDVLSIICEILYIKYIIYIEGIINAPSVLFSYVSTWEFLRTREKCLKKQQP